MPDTPPDQNHTEGSARDALAQRDFRLVFFGSMGSNIGRWMQQVVLQVVAWELTERPSYLGLILFAQMGPMLLLSVVGGAVADVVDRRKLLIVTQAWQMAWTFVLAAAIADGEIGEWALLAIVFATGLGQAFFAPAWNAVLPSIVGRRNLAAAISLNSTQINASRVIGPAIGTSLLVATGPAVVFLINGATYAFVIAALLMVTIPRVPPSDEVGMARLLGGFRAAAEQPIIGRSLLMMTSFALLCLPFIGQMAALVDLNLGMDPESREFGLFYACFGLGAVLGAFSVGSVFRNVPRPLLLRRTLTAFAVCLAVLALLRSAAPAYPTIFAVGYFYFATPTALTTHLQLHLDEQVRGRVMALWMMSFGGTVPIANLIAGPVIEWTSITAVVLFGAGAALVLALLAPTLDGRPLRSPALRSLSTSPEAPGHSQMRH